VFITAVPNIKLCLAQHQVNLNGKRASWYHKGHDSSIITCAFSEVGHVPLDVRNG